MRRRDFIAGLGSMVAASAWPFRVHTQQTVPLVGFITSSNLERFQQNLEGFRKGLGETGYVEGQNVTIDYRWDVSPADRAPAIVNELIDRPVRVLVVAGNAPITLMAKAATKTVPILFGVGIDPVKFNLVASLNRPGENVTGVSFAGAEVDAKRLGLLRDLAPKSSIMAALINPDTPSAEYQTRELQAAARVMGREILILSVRTEREFAAAFATLVEKRADALVITPNALYADHCRHLSALATRYSIPTISEWRNCTEGGGLISYGANIPESYRNLGNYVGRILKGAKPAELPVSLPTKFELVINLKTAKTLGLNVPTSIQLLADEVIE